MLYNIVFYLLEVISGFIAGNCLLRLYMQLQGIPMSARNNPLAALIFAVTNWLVLPLRRVIPSLGRWDMASLVAAFLVEMAEFLILWLLFGDFHGVASLPVLAVFALVRVSLWGMTGLLLVYVIMSWVQFRSYAVDLLERMVMPLLAPIRRVMPLVGNVDLSPAVLLVLLQISLMVLGELQAMALVAVLRF